MHAPFCCPNVLQWRWRFCVDHRLLNVWNGCRVDRAQTGRTFVLLCVYDCMWRCYELVFDTAWGRNFAHFAVHMHYSALIFLSLVYGTAIMLALNQQRVRCVCTLIWRCYWHSMQYGVVISPSSCVVQIHYNARWWFCVDLWSSNEWVAYWLWTNKQLVRLYCCMRMRLNLNMSVVCNAVWGRAFT